MALVERNKRVNLLIPRYDAEGNVVGLVASWQSEVVDDTDAVDATGVRSILATPGGNVAVDWEGLTATQRTAINAVVAKINQSL